MKPAGAESPNLTEVYLVETQGVRKIVLRGGASLCRWLDGGILDTTKHWFATQEEAEKIWRGLLETEIENLGKQRRKLEARLAKGPKLIGGGR